ncbi:MAG: hypothetical protein Q4D94_05150 [Bacillota bacterium]|nr:hypothetical protein [Bacillota bacterium]
MNKAVKGNYGYINTKRKLVILRTILFFAISLALFAAGILTTHTRRNLLTVVAVLGALPSCKSLVNMIIFIRAKGCSDSAYKQIKEAEGHLIGMYDMYFTSYQKNYALSHMVVEDHIILGFTEDIKCDLSGCRDHLETMLKQAGFKDMTITITNELSKYCDQLSNLNEKNQDCDAARDDEIRIALYDISL